MSDSTLLSSENASVATVIDHLTTFTLRPHRSVPDDVFDNVMIVGAAVAVIIDVVMFTLAGPIIGGIIAGNGIFLLLALFIHHRGHQATQSVRIHTKGIEVTSSGLAGWQPKSHKLSGLGLTVRLILDGQSKPSSILLRSGAVRCVVGEQLTEAELESFWSALRTALEAAGLAHAVVEESSLQIPMSPRRPALR